jgi:ABC-type uncharacterized transport system substrate-binding protein
MRYWLVAAISWRSFCARTFTAALAIALLLATLTQSQAADTEPKHVLMLHSFGLRFKPWSSYADAIRAEMSRRGNVDFQDRSLANARLDSDKSDGPFVEYLHALNADKPPDLIVAIGAPAAVFVQRHREDLFPKTPMVFTAVERRRVNFDKLTEYDAVVASSNDPIVFFENIFAGPAPYKDHCSRNRYLSDRSVLAERVSPGNRAFVRARAISMVQRTVF